MEHRFDIWRNDASTSVLDEKHKKKRHIDLYCYLRPRYVFPFEEISWKQRYASALSGAVKSMEHMQWQKIRWTQRPILPWTTSSCPQMANTSRTATIKNRYHWYTEYCGTEISFFSRSSSFPLTCGGGVIKTQKICNSSTFTLSCSREVR